MVALLSQKCSDFLICSQTKTGTEYRKYTIIETGIAVVQLWYSCDKNDDVYEQVLRYREQNKELKRVRQKS